MLEPSDSQEAYDFVAEAFALSEEFDTPVLLRSTHQALARARAGRAAASASSPSAIDYVKDITKHLMVPQWARLRTRFIIERLERLRERAERVAAQRHSSPAPSDFGIISSGVVLPVRP